MCIKKKGKKKGGGEGGGDLKFIPNKNITCFLAINCRINHFKSKIHKSTQHGTQCILVIISINRYNQGATSGFFLGKLNQMSDTTKRRFNKPKSTCKKMIP